MIATRNQEKKKSKGRPTVADARRLSKAVTVKFSKIDYEILRTRSRKANNLNQRTKMAHQDGFIYLYSPIDNLLGEITDVIREYKQGTNKKKR